MTKEELIKYCERQIAVNKMYPGAFQKRTILEYTLFLKLLKGQSVNDIFDEKGEYINDEN